MDEKFKSIQEIKTNEVFEVGAAPWASHTLGRIRTQHCLTEILQNHQTFRRDG